MACVVRLLCDSITCLGSGVLGFSYILLNGNGTKICQYVTLSTIGAGLVISLIRRNLQRTVNERNVVLITGCDSGLGSV